MKKRMKIAHKLARDLSKFDRKYKNIFICPTCLKTIELNAKKITDAHIVPDSVGGKELTLLCRPCNSKFGSNQDKWFGEYLDFLFKDEVEKNLFSTKTQPKYIEINGVRVRADVEQSTDSNIQVLMYEDRNPPGVIDSINYSDSLTMSFEVPLLKNEHHVKVGYLTAAYLAWFKQLGYSWAFQSHLDIIRKQILNPNEEIMPACFLANFPENKKIEPRVGVGIIEYLGASYPCCFVVDRLVLFPSYSHKSLYEDIEGEEGKQIKAKFYGVNISKAHEHVAPMAVIHGGKLVIFPDKTGQKALGEQQISERLKSTQMLLAGEPMRWMRQVDSESEYEKIKQDNEYIEHKINL
ncbi:HNH endonuclease [Porticoccus sp. W117]|uniref:HNH endonuclease n=1 Tax=Porticoccus sp. W117 TaxID=3054777 RepID=UPI002591818B|nr:HNH endonuclease [Porticoccus sp. W117]MDM3870743.1 HNH endonuclease [Porticoccus sp. W117]